MKAVKEQEVKEVKEVKVKEEVNLEEVVLKLPLADANQFMNFINMVLIKDDRAKSISLNFIEMIKRNNGDNIKQPNE